MTARFTGDVEINATPTQCFRQLREESPLYYNAQHDFYAFNRFEDVTAAIVDHQTFSSARERSWKSSSPASDSARHTDLRGPRWPSGSCVPAPPITLSRWQRSYGSIPLIGRSL